MAHGFSDDFGDEFGPAGPGSEGSEVAGFGDDGDGDDFSIFDVGLFSALGSLASLFAKSTPLGIGLAIGGRVLDKIAGTERTVTDAARRAVKGGLNRRNFEGDDSDPFFAQVGDEIASLPTDARNRRGGRSAGRRTVRTDADFDFVGEDGGGDDAAQAVAEAARR